MTDKDIRRLAESITEHSTWYSARERLLARAGLSLFTKKEETEERLRAALADLGHGNDVIMDLLSEKEAAEAALARAVEALSRYGRHTKDCRINPGGPIMVALGDPEARPCSCGLVEALEHPAAHGEEVSGMSENLAAPNPCQEQEQTIAQLRVQLAGCGVAALGATDPSQVAHPGDYGWSPAYEDTLSVRRRMEKAEAALGETQKRLERIQHRSTPRYRQMGEMMDDLAWVNDEACRALRIFVPVEGEEKP